MLSQQFYRKYGKRLFDLFLSMIGLIFLTPLYIVIATTVYLILGSPVLFRQQRPGLEGKPFTLLKFRTMKIITDYNGNPLPDSVRLTPFGRFLRCTSVDELPELFNVLKEDMSLVGPRPLLMKYLTRYTPEQMRRHDVKPGITGWAQINGRNNLTWEEKFALDVWYVENVSLLLDLKIIFISVWKVLRAEGISEANHPTAREFLGNK